MGPSIKRELMLVVAREARALILFAQHAVADDQALDFCAHEAPERVLRRAYYRLTPHIEARVDQHRAARALLKGRKQVPITRVRLAMHSLHASRIVDMSDSGDLGANNVELVDSEQRHL